MIFLLPSRCFSRWKARSALILAVCGAVLPAIPQEMPPECQALLGRFKSLVGRYETAGRQAIDKSEPGDAFAKARAAAMGGNIEATVTLVGISMLMRSQMDMFSVHIIRQVCTFSARNSHPLHVASCAYFNALNPLGERDVKRQAVEAELARFEAIRQQSQGKPFPGAEFEADITALKACLPRA